MKRIQRLVCVLTVLGVTDFFEGGGLDRLGQSVHDVRHLGAPSTAGGLSRGRPHRVLPRTRLHRRRWPAPERSRLCASSPAGRRPLGGLAVVVADRDQLLGPVGADTHDDQGTQACLFQSHVEADHPAALLDNPHNAPDLIVTARDWLPPWALWASPTRLWSVSWTTGWLEIITGERRKYSAIKAGLSTIPVFVRDDCPLFDGLI
jgi:hypothetical protein